MAQMLANMDEMEDEQDYFPAQVVDEAIGWLRKNRVHDKVFLWIDSFDPHEPWDPTSTLRYIHRPKTIEALA